MGVNYNNQENVVNDENHQEQQKLLPVANIINYHGMEARRIRQNIINTYFS